MKYATLPWACYISKAYAEEAQRRFLSPKQRYSSLNTKLSIAYSKYNLNLFSELSNYIHHFMNSFICSFIGSSVEYFVGYIHCKMRKNPAFSVKTDSKKSNKKTQVSSRCRLNSQVSQFLREMGLEPTRPIGHKILSLACLPFQHSRATEEILSQFPLLCKFFSCRNEKFFAEKKSLYLFYSGE